MRKLLALLLTLAMTLSLLSVGFVSTSAEEIPGDAIAIDDVNDFKPVAEGGLMEAGGVYKLTADIYVGSPLELVANQDGSTWTTAAPEDGDPYYTENETNYKIVPNAVKEEAEEHAIITIPAGVTIYGNGKTIYQNYYVKNPADYANASHQKGAGTHSLPWSHAMFALSAGDTITFNGVKFGSAQLPVHLTLAQNETRYGSESGASADTPINANDEWGMFTDAAGVSVVWNDVEFFVERYNGGLGNGNFGDILFQINGNHTFNNCVKSGDSSAGNQHGGWFYTSTADSSLTMTGCVTNGLVAGSYLAGVIRNPLGAVEMTRCINNATISGVSSYGTGYFSAFVGSASGLLRMENCTNNGAISVSGTAMTIGGAFVGRSSTTSLYLDGCVNNATITYSGDGKNSGNHGFGGIAGHISATSFTITNCVNNADIKGTGSLGGIVGRIDGGTNPVISNCKNFGDLTFTAKACQRIGGIVGQNNVNSKIQNCVNFGSITGNSTDGNAGVLAKPHDDSLEIDGCINYGTIHHNTYVGGMVAQTVTNDVTLTIKNSANFGTLTTGHTVGGMVAQVWGGTVDIDNCLNAGTIGNHANNEGVGGFIGRVASTAPVITIDNSANIGTIKGSTKKDSTYGIFGDTFGQFIGLYTVSAASTASYNGDKTIGGFHDWTADGAVKPTLTNCYAYGTATPAQNAESLTGWITKDAAGKEAKTVNVFTALNNDKLVAAGGESKTFTDDASKPAIEGRTAVTGSVDGKTYYKDSNGKIYSHSTTYTNAHIAVTVAPNNGMYGKNVEATLTNCEVLGVNEVTTASAIEKLNTLFDLDFMEGTAEEDKIVVATPALRGYQMSTDGTSIRFLSTISSLNYANVGYTYSATLNGAPVFTNKVATTTNVLQSINAVEGEDDMTTKSATEMGGKYIVALTFINVPAEGTVVITLTPNAGDFSGTTYTITIVDGNVTTVAPAAAN